ncbi:MAG: zeta toxin family protein [Puniceicoccales bacterium]|jgi:predicted ABC-type ATPase|nr:zeta toxin family protein [Puniceicoccales bacterium]
MPRPKLLIVAGPNGSGKTSVTGDILRHTWVEGCRYVNPDNIARDVFGDWNSPDAVLRAARLADAQRRECLDAGAGLIFETVFSSPEKLAFVSEAKARGYFIRLFFIGTETPQINAARIAHRVMQGGHDVPIAKIISRYYKSNANCALAAPNVDRLYVYDNSTENAPAKLLFRATNGTLARKYTDVNDWARNILSALRQ